MERYQGNPVVEKIAVGKIFIYKKKKDTPYREQIEDVVYEISRFEEARDKALRELDVLCEEAKGQIGSSNAAVFRAHRMLVQDQMYGDFIRGTIQDQKVNAEYAVAEAQAHFSQMLLGTEDAYLKERASDVADVSQRMLRLLGSDIETEGPSEPSIVVAEELTPSETMHFDRDTVLALVVQQGSANSHTAILAEAMNIPALLGVEICDEWEGRTAVLDGSAGELILDPDGDVLARMKEKQREIEERDAKLAFLRGRETVTAGGRKIRLYANIGELSDMDAVLSSDAEGIGLFRSEFLYLQAEDWPTEEEQAQVYRAVAETMRGKPVIIRTLDVGADKQAPYFELTSEENEALRYAHPEKEATAPGPGLLTKDAPAFGYRGIQVCLDRPEMFCTQLRSILRASMYGTVSVMFPMIASVEEVVACKELLTQAKSELRKEGKEYRDIEVGVMIETPAAVEVSAMLAREVDFFCIGTNDLIQYLLGVDRQDAAHAECADPRHPAVTEAIRTTIENGHAAGIWVGICGEMAADTTLTEMLVEMGVDELSVSPGAVLKVRGAVRELN
ncbi:MAG: phosphoenolpyruvate--protein phosphotransferase [Lachnospiraceae bacterium]|nr:phosphoenolpyruvate--protein phosphotransferase [Lachnospiraceae bacterium]